MFILVHDSFNCQLLLKRKYQWFPRVYATRILVLFFFQFTTEVIIYMYVKNVNNRIFRRTLSNFRSGSLKLAIETGRYAKSKIPLENRLCIFCDSSHIETETHFLLHCDFYTDIRRDLFSRANQVCGYFNNMNDTERMIFLMNNTHIINHVAKSLHTMFSRRKSHLSNL